MAQLFGASSPLLVRKKSPPARLLAFGSLRYDASLWTWRIMTLLA